MKLLQLSLLAVLTVAFSTRPTHIAEPICAGGDEGAYAYNLFTPISFTEFTDFWRKPENSETANIEDWLAYLNGKPKATDISEVVYKLSADDMQKVRASISTGKLPENWQKNTLLKYWQTNKDLEAIDYLIYAKNCEAQAGVFDDWSEAKRDLSKTKQLAEAGKKAYTEKAPNDFLKTRYAYQAVRMAHYSEQFQKGIDLYNELAKPLEAKSKSPILHWALAHKAGCLKRVGKDGEANYLFAQIFDKCPSKRVSSALSWSVETEQQWQSAISACQKPEETAPLYFLRALDTQADGVAEMKNIYEKVPNYDKLPVMLMREINQLENKLMNVNLNENLFFLGKSTSSSPEAAAKQLHKLKEFVSKCVAESKVDKKEVFMMASGYLDFMAGNGAQGLKKMDDLAKQTKDPIYQKQIEVCKLAIQLSSLTKIDETVENDLFNTVQNTDNQTLKTFMWHVFEKLYEKQGEAGKAQLCYKGGLQYTPNLAVLDQLITVADKKKKTALETYILKQANGTNPKAHFQEIKATYLLYQDKIAEAIAVFEQVPAEMIGKIQENPLAYAIQNYETYPDNIDKNKYDKLKLAYKMQNLKKMIETPSGDQAMQYFQLGCIYYNITYFGNSWQAVDYFRSTTDLANLHQSNQSTYANFDCEKAKYYFDRAMNVALKDQNKELGAKAAYLAAKCEQNKFYTSSKNKDVWGYIEPSYAPEHRRYFATLKKEFANTKYYKEILAECSYFNTFLKK